MPSTVPDRTMCARKHHQGEEVSVYTQYFEKKCILYNFSNETRENEKMCGLLTSMGLLISNNGRKFVSLIHFPLTACRVETVRHTCMGKTQSAPSFEA